MPLEDLIRETKELLARMQAAYDNDPKSNGLRINCQSLAKRLRELESELANRAAVQ